MEFIWPQLFARLPYPETSFDEQVIIVTGSNIGLGLEAARHFTRLNAAKVILAVRSIEKGNAAKKAIEESTSRPTNVIEVWPLDLSSYDSVKAFAERASTTLPRLDILVENAGIATQDYSRSEDNESTITVNVISTYLLALLLLPKLRETGQRFNNTPRPPHLVVVASEVHYLTDFPEQSAPHGAILATLNEKSTANMKDRYKVSKLLEVFFTRELASRSPPPSSPLSRNGKGGVVINFLTPGFCHSELGRDVSGWALWAFWLMKLVLARSTEVGSRTLLHASAAGEASHGKFLSSCEVWDVAPLVRRDEVERGGELQRRVWDEVMERLERIQPGIGGNV
jgi:NAD(P)-dependent dehydrogenase (short-subunit alcohol dehydrogenase family)